MQLLAQVLRTPGEVAHGLKSPQGRRELGLTCLAATAVAMGVFGAVLGSFRGGLQIVYSAVKLPFVWLLTLCICTPLFYALLLATGRGVSFTKLTAWVLIAATRSSVVLVALCPILWLMIDIQAGYHQVILAAMLAFIIGSFFGVSSLRRTLGTSPLLLRLVLLGTFLVTGAQLSWGLRPYLGRPSQLEVPFVRAAEGSFVEAMGRSAMSSVGIFTRDISSGSEHAQGRPAPVGAARERRPVDGGRERE